MTSESDIQKQIFDYLVQSGFLVMRINGGRVNNMLFSMWQSQGNPRSVGISDLLALSPTGQLYAIEVKRPGGKPSDCQTLFMREVKAREAVALVVTSLDDVIAITKLSRACHENVTNSDLYK